MTPEQIERLKNAILHGPYYEGWTDDFLALLAEWEERGRETAWQEERNANNVRAYAEEVERLSEQLQLCTVPDGWETWRRNAEAEIERLTREAQDSPWPYYRQWKQAEARLAKVVVAAREALSDMNRGLNSAQDVEAARAAAQPEEEPCTARGAADRSPRSTSRTCPACATPSRSGTFSRPG